MIPNVTDGSKLVKVSSQVEQNFTQLKSIHISINYKKRTADCTASNIFYL